VVERGVENAIVDVARGRRARSRTPRAGQPLAATFEDGYEGTFSITAHALDQVVEHARANTPLLCCGLLAESDSGISVHRGKNSSPTPGQSWVMTPGEIVRLEDEIAAAGGDPIAIYHSLSPAFARNLDYLTEDAPLRVPVLLCFVSDPPQFRVFDVVRGGLVELKIELIEHVEGYPEFELFVDVKEGHGPLAIDRAELLKRFAGTYDDVEDLDDLLADTGFRLSTPVASARGGELIEIQLDNPPVAYELRYRVDHNAGKQATVAIADLLDDLARKRLTDPAREEILSELDDVGLECDEQALYEAGVDDKLTVRRASASD
jgi:proteasome lid subunit RPN8/RPN11